MVPTLTNITQVLRRYSERYVFLDAFADDVDELRDGTLGRLPATQAGPARVAVQTSAGRLLVELFPEQGIARFRIAEQNAPRGNGDQIAAGATLGGLLGVAVSAASSKKEGLLGGLIVGMLVGGHLGNASPPVERVLALRFDQATGEWQVYDGPLLRWAKRTLNPGVPPAA